MIDYILPSEVQQMILTSNLAPLYKFTDFTKYTATDIGVERIHERLSEDVDFKQELFKGVDDDILNLENALLVFYDKREVDQWMYAREKVTCMKVRKKGFSLHYPACLTCGRKIAAGQQYVAKGAYRHWHVNCVEDNNPIINRHYSV